MLGVSQSNCADMRRAFQFELDSRVVRTLTELAARASVPADRHAEIVAALLAQAAQAERSAATAMAEQREAERAAAAKATAAIEMDKRNAAAAAMAAAVAAAKAAQPAAKHALAGCSGAGRRRDVTPA